jgi:hypothetical protein
MDPLVLTLTIVSTVLAVFLVIVGIQAFLVLREAKRTLARINGMIDMVEHTALRAILPLSNVGGFIAGMKGGMKVFETFVNFLKRNEDDE